MGRQRKRPASGLIAREPDIEAEVTYLATEAGGRRRAVGSGYRPNHLVMPDYLTCGQHEYLDVEVVQPGETARAYIWFITPEIYPNTMWVGRTIRVQEGSRVVAHAEVTQVFNRVLEGDAEHPLPTIGR